MRSPPISSNSKRKKVLMTNTTLTLPTPTTIEVQRRFDAPIGLVYAAHMEPQHVTQWLSGPDGWKLTSATMDVRAGGSYTWEYSGPEGKSMTLNGEYLEVDPPNRVLMRESWGPNIPSPVVETLFAEEGGQTLVTITMTLPDQATRDHVVSDGGMEKGYHLSHSNLDDYLPRVNDARASS